MVGYIHGTTHTIGSIGGHRVGRMGWVKERFVPKPLDEARMEERMKKEGTLKADGTIAVDREFDAELNALARELKAIDADVSAELDAGASVQ